MTTDRISQNALESVLREEGQVDRPGRVSDLETQLAAVRAKVAKQQEADRKVEVLRSAFAKLKRDIRQTLTAEELAAVDGAYLHIHDGMIDLVRNVPAQGEANGKQS